MAVKFLYYFIFLFIGVMVFLLLQKPYHIEVNQDAKKEANIEMFGAKNYSISQNGVESIFVASKVLRFPKYDEFHNVDVIRKTERNVLENILTNKAFLVKDDVELMGNVRYKNSDNVKFSTSLANYNLKSKVFKADEKFILEDDSTIIYGNSLVYQSNDGKIYANNIRSIAEVEEK